MPIDPKFSENLKPVGMHNDHIVWGPGRIGGASNDPNVAAAYSQAGKQPEALGIHGTFVAVDWDECIADGSCLPVCPVALFEWTQSQGKNQKDDRSNYMDKSDPVRESDCIFCMACVTVCPVNAIKVDQALVDFAKTAAANVPQAT